MPRLLLCHAHKTVDVMPDYDTAMDMEGRNDIYLLEAIEDHCRQYGPENPSGPPRHPSQIFRITQDEFDLLNLQDMREAMFNDELEEYLKGQRDTFKEDAVNCYYLHNKPVVGFPGCIDYRSDAKAITKTGPKEDWVYLCDFCPYQSYVDYEIRKKAGTYGR